MGSQTYRMTKGEYVLTINNNPNTLSDGLASTYLAEVRVWKSPRYRDEIVAYRFHQLDVVNQRSNLYSYIKLFNGGF